LFLCLSSVYIHSRAHTHTHTHTYPTGLPCQRVLHRKRPCQLESALCASAERWTAWLLWHSREREEEKEREREREGERWVEREREREREGDREREAERERGSIKA